MVPQERPVGAHDQHVDDVEADLDVAVGRVACEPGRCRDLKVAALDLAALEAALAVLGCGDVDEDQDVVVAGDQIDLGSLGGSPTGIEKLVSLALDEAGGCLDCLLLKFEIAHDDLRLFVSCPFGLPCDPEAAQVLAKGKESSENPAGPKFCAAKVFRALPKSLALSECGGAKEGEGGMPDGGVGDEIGRCQKADQPIVGKGPRPGVLRNCSLIAAEGPSSTTSLLPIGLTGWHGKACLLAKVMLGRLRGPSGL